jgi:hypothetical protein
LFAYSTAQFSAVGPTQLPT